jgi:predicted metal-dependent peptidase
MHGLFRYRHEHGSTDQLEQEAPPQYTAEDAMLRLRSYIVKGILDDEFVPVFFSNIRKVFARLGMAHAAVVMTENGVRLVIDIDFVCGASDDDLDFTLSHELMHVLNMHFLRGFDLMEELQIGTQEFFGYYAKFADLPVNYSLNHLRGCQDREKKKTLLTYENVNGLEQWEHPTFESIVHFLYKNYPPEKAEQLVAEGKGGPGEGNPTVIKVNEDGTTEVISKGDGQTVVVIPEIEKETKREHIQDVKDLVDTAEKTAGTTPHNIRRAIDSFMDIYRESLMTGWDILKGFLVGFRNINKGRVRTFRRLNRRTGLLPGKRHIKGFRALWLVDESGSMSDEDVQTALILGKKAMQRDNSDKMFYIHWDTEPSEEVEEISTVHDIEKIERKKSGGTDFTELFRHPLVLQQDVDIYIVVTDGYPYHWPDSEPTVPHIWVITDAGGYKEWQDDYGKGIAIDVSAK